MDSKYLKEIEKQNDFHQKWHDKKVAVESSVFNSMAEMDYEGAREFLERKDEHEKLYNSIIKKKDKETSKEKIENNFDSLEKWKEDMNRNLQ